MIAAWKCGAYLSEEGVAQAIDVQVSTRRRLASHIIPALGKAGCNYLSSQLIKLEVLENGYAEDIAVDYHGNIGEGSCENIFSSKMMSYTPRQLERVRLLVLRELRLCTSQRILALRRKNK